MCEIQSIELAFLLTISGGLLSQDLLLKTPSTRETAAPHLEKTGMLRMSNLISVIAVHVISHQNHIHIFSYQIHVMFISYCYSYGSITSFACKSSPMHKSTWRHGNTAARAMAEHVRSTSVHQRRWLGQCMLLTWLACIASFASFKGTWVMIWTFSSICWLFWCFHLAALIKDVQSAHPLQHRLDSGLWLARGFGFHFSISGYDTLRTTEEELMVWMACPLWQVPFGIVHGTWLSLSESWRGTRKIPQPGNGNQGSSRRMVGQPRNCFTSSQPGNWDYNPGHYNPGQPSCWAMQHSDKKKGNWHYNLRMELHQRPTTETSFRSGKVVSHPVRRWVKCWQGWQRECKIWLRKVRLTYGRWQMSYTVWEGWPMT